MTSLSADWNNLTEEQRLRLFDQTMQQIQQQATIDVMERHGVINETEAKNRTEATWVEIESIKKRMLIEVNGTDIPADPVSGNTNRIGPEGEILSEYEEQQLAQRERS